MPVDNFSTAIFFTACIAVVAVGFAGADQQVLFASKKILGQFQPLDRLFRLFSFPIFPVTVLFFIPAFLLWQAGDRVSLIRLFTAGVLAVLITFLGKLLCRRQRPLHQITLLGRADSSFPSAHTAGSFAAAFILAGAFPPFAALGFSFAALVALSRIYLQLHFLSDVAAGLTVGFVTALIVVKLNFLNLLILSF